MDGDGWRPVMAGGFQRISHRVRRSRSWPRARTVVKYDRLTWFSGDEICRGLRGKPIWLRGDQRPSHLQARRASAGQAWGSLLERKGRRKGRVQLRAPATEFPWGERNGGGGWGGLSVSRGTAVHRKRPAASAAVASVAQCCWSRRPRICVWSS